MNKIAKTLNLEEKVLNEYHTPVVYDAKEVIDWFVDGYTEIRVTGQNYRAFLLFAAVNSLLTINSEGKAYVAGMRVIEYQF